MNETQDTLSAGVGMLSMEQAATQLPFDDPVNAVLYTKRLVARRSIEAAQLGKAVRIPAEKLHAFMVDNAQNSAERKAQNLPLETLTPIFPLMRNERNWFVQSPVDMLSWQSGLYAQMKAFLPERVMRPQPGMVPNSDDTLMIEAGTPVVTIDIMKSFPSKAKMDALKSIINAPTPAALPFKNMGEIFLAQRLHEMVWDVINRKHAPGVESVVERLYSSAENYSAIVSEAVGGMPITACLTAVKFYSEVNAQVMVRVSDADLMTLAGSNPGRLACLAF